MLFVRRCSFVTIKCNSLVFGQILIRVSRKSRRQGLINKICVWIAGRSVNYSITKRWKSIPYLNHNSQSCMFQFVALEISFHKFVKNAAVIHSLIVSADSCCKSSFLFRRISWRWVARRCNSRRRRGRPGRWRRWGGWWSVPSTSLTRTPSRSCPTPSHVDKNIRPRCERRPRRTTKPEEYNLILNVDSCFRCAVL